MLLHKRLKDRETVDTIIIITVKTIIKKINRHLKNKITFMCNVKIVITDLVLATDIFFRDGFKRRKRYHITMYLPKE